MLNFRPYDPQKDEACLFNLWVDAFGPSWPVGTDWLRSVTQNLAVYQPGDHLLADVDGQTAGFALTQTSRKNGSILALGVLPLFRRQGVGRALHAMALERLRTRGVSKAFLGSGAPDYFWPGVPVSLENAWPFFQRQGWEEEWRSVDLARSLVDYQTPAWVWDRVSGQNLVFETLSEAAAVSEDLRTAVIEFVAVEHPGWAEDFTRYIGEDRLADVLIAHCSGSQEIQAACLLDNDAQRWALCLDWPVGAPGCILTGEAYRARGIGMALTARATEILLERGCRTSFIGWTWLEDWYGKLGYKLWCRNVMSNRVITCGGCFEAAKPPQNTQ
jgi:ribosomal protein S18 acetylase RimI-like enzyme